jgi:hypothetical protein
MSNFYQKLIPNDPDFVPDASKIAEAYGLFQTYFSETDYVEEITFEIYDEIQFVDAGACFESVRCPSCGVEISNTWSKLMDECWQGKGFGNLILDLPCCGEVCSLNDLDYYKPQGFARFALIAHNANRAEFEPQEIKCIELILGCSLRQIFTLY